MVPWGKALREQGLTGIAAGAAHVGIEAAHHLGDGVKLVDKVIDAKVL